MSLTVYGAMKLRTLRNFRLVAGQLGLDRRVTKTGILDYEFAGDMPEEIENQFDPGELVLSSMLYAKENEEAVVQAVEKLNRLGASALAIKTIYYKELPDRVREVADRERFPVFLFDNSVFFEDIIAEISETLRSTDRLQRLQSRLEALLYREWSPAESRGAAMELNSAFKGHVRAYFGIPVLEAGPVDFDRAYEVCGRSRLVGQESLLVPFKEGVLVLVTDDGTQPQTFELRFEELLEVAGLRKELLRIGKSAVHPTEEALADAVKEAYWAQLAAEGEESPVKAFQEVGIYRLLLPVAGSPWAMTFSEEVLEPVRRQDRLSGSDLMGTAVAYVRCGGNAKRAAELLFVHENTVRYRMGKVQELLAPGAGELRFYELLSTALRLWLLKTENRCI